MIKNPIIFRSTFFKLNNGILHINNNSDKNEIKLDKIKKIHIQPIIWYSFFYKVNITIHFEENKITLHNLPKKQATNLENIIKKHNKDLLIEKSSTYFGSNNIIDFELPKWITIAAMIIMIIMFFTTIILLLITKP